MTSSWHTLAKTFFTLGAIALLLMGFLGMSHMGMTMGPDGKMSIVDCPFMNGSGICNMTPFEHVAMWQSIVTNIPLQFDTTLVLLLLFLAGAKLMFPRFLYPPADTVLTYVRSYSRHEHVPRVTSLQALFSNGILNPKLF